MKPDANVGLNLTILPILSVTSITVPQSGWTKLDTDSPCQSTLPATNVSLKRMLFSVLLLPALLFAQAPTPAPKAAPKVAPKAVSPKPAGTPAAGTAKPAAAAPKPVSAAKPGAPKAASPKPVAGAKPAPTTKLTTDDQKIIYSLGLSVAKSLAQFDLTPAELNILKQAITDSASGKPAIDINEWGPKIQGLAHSRGTKVAEREKAVARAFVAKIASTPGAVSSESGLVFIEQTAGTGKSPQATDTVTVHYRGTLTDGTEFDSSYKRKHCLWRPRPSPNNPWGRHPRLRD
jgi:FKBP-type peptidyl-prolyl cis-trans isomerase